MSSDIFPVSRSANLVVRELKDEILIYDLKAHKAFSLNETSALVWQECNGGQRSVAEISQIMSKKLKTYITEDLVWLAIDQLKKNNLMSDAGEMPVKFAGSSRREVIRRIGFAALVTMPIITSLVVPTAAHAASGGAGAGQACTGTTGTQGSCASNLICKNNTCCIPVNSGITCTTSAQCCTGECGSASQLCIVGDDGDTPIAAPNYPIM